MVKLRLATFNCENLFVRFKFKKNVNPEKAVKDGWLVDKTFFDIHNPAEKRITAEAIKKTKANVIALEEVESMDALKRFRNKYLDGSKKFKHVLVIDGNDPRKIDVGVLSEYPLETINTHIHEWDKKFRAPLFSRDCLECDIVLPNKKRLRLYVNHLKSMLDKKNPCNGRRNTRERRLAQARRVKEIVSKRFPDTKGNYAILGDLNDYLDSDAQGKTAIGELVRWNKVVNIVDRLPPQERWTQYFKGNKKCGIPEAYKQLDYILLSKSLAERNKNAKPEIIRNGLPRRATRYSGARFKGVGENDPKASDHCPVVIELNM